MNLRLKRTSNGRFLLRSAYPLKYLCKGRRSYYLDWRSKSIYAASPKYTAAVSELLELLTAYRRGAKYHRLKDGSFAIMDTALHELEQLTNTLDISDKELLKDKLHIPQYRMLYLDSLKADSNIRLNRSPEFKAAVRRFHELAEDSEQFPLPAELEGIMRDYQKYGFRWLKTVAGYGFGGILADDMGLGKTIQAISLIQDMKQREETHLPCLVVCPSSLTLNWESELKRFAPSLRTLVVIGTATQRSMLMERIPEAVQILLRNKGVGRAFIIIGMHIQDTVICRTPFKHPDGKLSIADLLIICNHTIND